jgi:hypothetical protein
LRHGGRSGFSTQSGHGFQHDNNRLIPEGKPLHADPDKKIKPDRREIQDIERDILAFALKSLYDEHGIGVF